jgi:hypothetical protein
MKITTKDGITIEMAEGDSASQLTAVLAALGVRDAPRPPQEQQESRFVSLRDKLEAFSLSITSEQQRELLYLLVQSPEGLPDEELRAKLNISGDNKALAGTMAGLSRRAVGFGLELNAHIMTKETKRGPSGRVYRYRLTPQMREVLNEAIKNPLSIYNC